MKGNPMKKILAAIIAILYLNQNLYARQPYHTTITVDTVSASVSDPNLVDLSRDLQTDAIEVLIPIYTPVSPVSFDINLRGIQALASFAANSNVLTVEIPQTGISQTYEGATRDDSIALFKESIRDGGPRHKLLRAYAKYSPIDPIAGNPNSLMAQMAHSDYAMGTLSPMAGCSCGWTAQPILHQFQMGLEGIRAFSSGYDTTAVTFPLRYSYSPDRRSAFIIDAPLTYFRNGGASSIFGTIGFGLRYQVNKMWSLTPIFRLGSGGSLDLCTSGNFVALGLTSVLQTNYGGFVWAMTNYAGYFSSVNLWLSGINFNYHLHNYIFKNGITITSCEGFNLCGRNMNASFAFVDTCFTKDKLFIQHYDEITAMLIVSGLNPCLDYDCASIGFTYQFGEKHYRGYSIKLIYQF